MLYIYICSLSLHLIQYNSPFSAHEVVNRVYPQSGIADCRLDLSRHGSSLQFLSEMRLRIHSNIAYTFRIHGPCVMNEIQRNLKVLHDQYL
jgi:hypothetical protein